MGIPPLSAVDRALAVRRDLHPAQHAGQQAVGGDRDPVAQGREDPPRRPKMEGDILADAILEAYPVKGPPGPQDQRLGVAGPAERGVDPVDRPGLLEITLDGMQEKPLSSAREVLHDQTRASLIASDERQPLAVGRWRRPCRCPR